MSDRTETRVVVLGASNVTLGLSWVVTMLRAGFPEPLHLSIAHGHGRSYGMWSRVLVRELPGLSVSPIWETIEETPPDYALLTDIGNDLVYGASVDEIAGWVESCGQRLTDAGARVIMTELPMASVRRLSRRRYVMFRTLFFPSSRVSHGEIQAKADALNQAISEISASLGATLVRPEPLWYGLDPIHIRRSARATAWAEIMRGWPGWTQDPNAKLHRSSAIRLWRLKPRQRKWFGRIQERDQSLELSRKTRVGIY